MLNASLQIDASPLAAFAGRFRQLAERPMEDPYLRGGFEEAMRLYAEASQRRFERASAGDGTWPALKRPRPNGQSQRILFVTGTLYRSLAPGDQFNIFEPLPSGFRYGTSVWWAKFHQRGSSRLPQRQILVPPTQELLDRCVAPIVEGLRKAIYAHADA